MSLASALEDAAEALPGDADAIRPANGDPERLLAALDAKGRTRVLGWLLAHASEDAGELLEAWSEAPDGVAAALAVDEAALPKAGRKALRRVRHRLRSQGQALPSAAPANRIASLPALDDAFHAGLVTAPDPLGVRLVYLVEPDPSGGARLFEITLDDARGILDAALYRAGRSKVRAFLREVTGRRSLPAESAPPDAVRALLARVAARQPARTRLPEAFEEWRSHLAPADSAAPTPGDLAAQEFPTGAEPVALREAADAVRAGDFGPWPPPAERLRAVAERVRERAGSALLVNPAQRREQGEAALEASLEEIWDAAACAACADRLRELAFLHWKRADEAAARRMLAAAAGFAELPAAENPVARALLTAVFEPLLREVEQGEASTPAPDEAADPLGVRP